MKPLVTSSERFLALGLCTAAYAVCFAVWTLLGPLAPLFREAYRLSAAEASLLVAVPPLVGALAGLPAGLLADLYGARRVFVGLMVLLAGPTALAGLSTSYGWLLFWAFWLGLAGASFAVGFPFVVEWFPPWRQGLALGIYGLGNAGAGLAALLAPPIAFSLGWPAAFWAFSLALLAMAALLGLVARDPPGQSSSGAAIRTRLAVFWRRPLAWGLSAYSLVTFGGFLALSVHLPTLLTQRYGLDLASAGAQVAGFVAIATLARPLGGHLADRLGGERVLNLVFLATAVLAAALALDLARVLAAALLLGLGLALGAGNGAVVKLVAERFPAEAGAVSGLVGAIGSLGGLVLPLAQGLVQDLAGSYVFEFLLLAALALASLSLNLLVATRTGRG